MKRITFLPLLVLLITLAFSSCEENKYEDWKLLNESWLDIHKTDPGFVQTESGLCYKVIHQGRMKKPTSTSYITIKYTGKIITGTKFDSNDSRDLNLSSLPAGLIEGITKMQVPGRYIFYVPWNLAYKEDGFGTISPYSTLIFDIELLDCDDQALNFKF